MGSADYGGLWPDRPTVALSFDVAADLRTATGRESIVFTPDLPVCELVFRAWPNTPNSAGSGSSLVLTDATVDGRPVNAAVAAAGAPHGAPGTLIELPLAGCRGPGQQVRAELGFRLTMGTDADERLGSSPTTRTAWFGSGFPLLAWVRGQGWAREPAVGIAGETATSEEFELSASVTAPAEYRVLGTGAEAGGDRK